MASKMLHGWQLWWGDQINRKNISSHVKWSGFFHIVGLFYFFMICFELPKTTWENLIRIDKCLLILITKSKIKTAFMIDFRYLHELLCHYSEVHPGILLVFALILNGFQALNTIKDVQLRCGSIPGSVSRTYFNSKAYYQWSSSFSK